MSKKENTEETSSNQITPWYNYSGNYDDVIISTRLRLVRNLADFPFCVKLKADDKDRVASLIYYAFSEDESFHYIKFSEISAPGREILSDKNIIKNTKNFNCSAILLNSDECTSAIVNDVDHLKISSFTAGLDPEKLIERVYKTDEFLQTKLQFAASYEFGYLTSRIKDCGTGMKISIRVFIPSIVLSGKFDDIVSLVQEKNYIIKPLYKSGEKADFSNCIFDIYPTCCAEGTELDQMASIQSIGMLILKTERKIRAEFADNNPTIVFNFVKRSYARAEYSLLLSYEETVNIISAIKWGLQTKVLTGISENELNSLYYRTKHGHLLYLSDNFAFSFEKDIKSDLELQIQRLRAVVIQQAFEKISFI